MAQDTGTTAATARLTAAPGGHQEQRTKRDFGVIEGRLDTATRILRFLGTTVLVTFIVGLVGALVLHATIIENQRDLDSQRNDIVRIAADTEGMRSELAELEAPARIVDEARALGMIEAPSIEYLTAPGATLDERTLIFAANQLRDNG
jgi:cell division protein FtsL